MADRIGALWVTPATVSVQLHRDVGPRRRLRPSHDNYEPPWLDGLASYASLRRLAQILDPLVLLVNLGGYAVTEIVVAPDPSRSNKVAGISLPECNVGQIFRDPTATTDTCWRVYAGVDFPAGATFALGLRMEIERVLGRVYYAPGVAINFTDPSVIAWADPADDLKLFDRLLLLSSPDALHLDDWLPVLADVVADDGGLRSRLVADLVAAAHHVAAATTPVVPAGQLSLYAPSRWRPPRTARSAEDQKDYLDPFVQLGYAMVEHVLPDPDALGRFLMEETRLSRRVLKAAGAVSETAPERVSFRSRLRQIDETTRARPSLLGMARRCEEETRRESADPIVALDTWTVPRPGLRAVDLRLSYTEWLLVAAQLGVIDPLSAIGVDAAVASTARPLASQRAAISANSRSLHPWLPASLSRHAVHIRGLASNIWMTWENDRPRAITYLTRILELLPTEPPTFDLAWQGMPDAQLTRDFPAMRSWDGTELDDARAMVEELIADEEGIDGDAMFERLRELELVLPALDEYWLQTEPPVGPLDELVDILAEFGEGFAAGFLIPFEGDPVATASLLWDLHRVNAPYLPLLSTVIAVGAMYGIGEYMVDTVTELFDWLVGDPLLQAIQAIQAMLDSGTRELGLQFGNATAIMALETAEKLLSAVTPEWYAFELGRLLGPVLFDVVLCEVFAGYVVPRLAKASAAVLRKAVEKLDVVVDLRRAWVNFDRHAGGHGSSGHGSGGGGSGGHGNGGGGSGGHGNGDGDGEEAPPPFDPFDRLDQMLEKKSERVQWIRTKLGSENRRRLLAVLNVPERSEHLLCGLRVLSDLTPDDKVFQAVIRTYTSSDVKLGIPETLGRIEIRETAKHKPRRLEPSDFEFPAPPPSPSAEQIQQRALEVIARRADSPDELNKLASPMGVARSGSDMEKLQNIWAANQDALARRLVGDLELDTDLWDNGQNMPVQRPPGWPRTQGRVRATRVDESGRTLQVEGWLSHTTGDNLPDTVAREVKVGASLPYPMHASHLFPLELGGPPELWNLIATSARFNLSWMKKTENALGKLFTKHGELYLRIDLTWGKGKLPTSITYRAYERGAHGGPVPVDTEMISGLEPRVPHGKTDDKPLPVGMTIYEPRLGEDIENVYAPLLHRVAPEL